jgi:peptidyl-tRNA hydrolase
VCSDPTLRLYAIARGDLEMTPGKLAAQAGHAYLDAFNKARDKIPKIAEEYLSDSHGTKVCLLSAGLHDLMQTYEAAMQAGIPCALIVDSGHVMPPHFDGSPIITALGLGPVTREQIGNLTNKYQLA